MARSVPRPPRFQRARRETDEGGVFPRDVWAGVRPFSRKTPANNEIHSEMSILGRASAHRRPPQPPPRVQLGAEVAQERASQ